MNVLFNSRTNPFLSSRLHAGSSSNRMYIKFVKDRVHLFHRFLDRQYCIHSSQKTIQPLVKRINKGPDHLFSEGRNFHFILFLVTTTALLILSQQSAVEAEETKPTVADLDELRALANILGTSLPKQEENENKSSWYKRCVEFCFVQVFKLCLNQQWDLIDRLDDRTLSYLTDKWNRSLLIAAVQEASTACVYKLLEKEIAISRTDEEGNTPLHIAVEMGRSDLIRKLSSWYQNTRNQREETALHVAIRQGHSSCVRILLDWGASQYTYCNWNGKSLDPLALAVASGQQECFDVLMHNMSFPETEQQIEGVGNLLHLAISTGNFQMLNHLLCEYHENFKGLIDKGDELKRSPLILASYFGDLNAIQLLYEKKAATGAMDKQGRTAAHWAAIGYQEQALELLGSLGVNLNIESATGRRPEDYLESDSSEQAKLTLNQLRKLIAKQQDYNINGPDFTYRQPENLVFKAVGLSEIVYVGVLRALKEKNMLEQVRRVAGISTGAIIATLFAVGYSPEEIESISLSFDLKTFLDLSEENKKLHEIQFKLFLPKDIDAVIQYNLEGTQRDLIKMSSLTIVRKLLELKGLCEGELVREWIEKKIEEKTGKRYCTFGELQQLVEKRQFGAKHLYLYASRIDKIPELICFNSEERRDQDVIISDAVRASLSVPGVFKPHTIHYKREGNRMAFQNAERYVDGGLLNNFPINAFDSIVYQNHRLPQGAWITESVNPCTLGISAKSENSERNYPGYRITDPKDLLVAIAQFYYNAEEVKGKQSHRYDEARTIEIPIESIVLLDFHLPFRERAELVQAGYAAVNNSSKFAKLQKTNLDLPKLESTNFTLSRLSRNFVGRDEYIKNLATCFTSKNYDPNVLLVHVLFGLPGMGKTQIAMHFANSYRGYFSQIWVIDCRTDASIDDGYRQIAEKLKIAIIPGVPIDQIQRRVHIALENKIDKTKPWLLILDNVDKFIDSRKDLPRQGGCILITTNKRNVCPEQNEIEEVHPFNAAEAISLLKKVIGENIGPEAVDLAKSLGYFPLALNLAANCIMTTYPRDPNGIKKYLEAYQKDPLRAPWDRDHLYEYSLQKAFGLTLSRLEKENREAVEWLNICAYLSPEQIPEAWLNDWMKEKMINEPSWKVKSLEILRQLRNYGLIQDSRTEETFSIHRLLQHMLRERQTIKDVYLLNSFSLVQNCLEKFDQNNPDTWTSGKKGYVHASWLFENGLLKNQSVMEQVVVLDKLGLIAYQFNTLKKALEFYEASLEIKKKIYGSRPHLSVAKSLNNLGEVWRSLGNTEKALKFHKESFKIIKQFYGDQPHPDTARSLNNLGKAWESLGDIEKALEFYETSFKMNKELYGDQPHPDTASSLNNLGKAWEFLNDAKKALKFYQASFEMKKRLYGNQPHPDTASSLNNLGMVWKSLGDIKMALAFCKASLEMNKQLYGDQPHPDTARSLNNLGMTWESLGDIEKALAFYEISFEMNKQLYGDQPHPDTARSLNNLGMAWESLENREKAKEYVTEAYAIFCHTIGEHHPETQSAKRNKEELERKESDICSIQ